MARIERHRKNEDMIPLKIEVLSLVISWKHGLCNRVTSLSFENVRDEFVMANNNKL